MEKRTRAYRRHKKEVKFKKRLKIWLPREGRTRYRGSNGICSYEEFVGEVVEGKAWTFLRTTSRPCNCSWCTEYEKYRTYRAKYNREAEKEIEEQLLDDSEETNDKNEKSWKKSIYVSTHKLT